MAFLDLKHEAFGLDINDLSLKIVKLKKRSRGFSLVSLNELKMEPDIVVDGVIKKEASLIRNIKFACDTVKGEKLKTKYVIASLPEEETFSQVIQMPKMTDEELKLAVPLEAENYIPLPIDDVYLDFVVIPPIKDYFSYLEVLIVAVPKKIVDSYVSCIKKAGLVPLALEEESGAIARALVKKQTNSPLLILVDFGEDGTNLVILSGGSVRFTCSIPVSSRSLTTAISEFLKVDFHEAERLKMEYGLLGRKGGKHLSSRDVRAEKVSQIIAPIIGDLTDEIKKYLNFYKDHSSYEYLLTNGKAEKILLCGGGSELKGIADFIFNKLEIPTEVGNPSVNFLAKKNKNTINKNLLSFTTAIGLSLRQIDNQEIYL